MRNFLFILLSIVFFSCKKDYIADNGINLDVINSISIDETVDYGVKDLPSDAGSEINRYFDKYTRYIAENGKYIHIFGPSNMSKFELARQREVLTGILNNYSSGMHGTDKGEVADYLANQNACLMYFSTVEDFKKATEGVLLVAPIEIHPILYDSELFTEGSSEFILGESVDKSMTRLMRMILKSGIANTNFGYNSEIYNAANNARSNSVWIPVDPDSLLAMGDIGLSYISMLLEVYYGQWQKSGIVNGGEYLYPDRANLTNDQLGLAAIETFFHPHLPYKVIMDPDFNSDLELEFDSGIDYTYRSQYFANVDISASACAVINANSYDNILTGNGLDNTFTGNAGNDVMDGGDGFDVSIYNGIRNEYLIAAGTNGETIVQDTVQGRDDVDTLYNFERLQFTDINVDL